MVCNPEEEECELIKLKYDAIYWKSIVCSDSIKIEDYERVKELHK